MISHLFISQLRVLLDFNPQFEAQTYSKENTFYGTDPNRPILTR